MAKARPLRKAGRKAVGKPVKSQRRAAAPKSQSAATKHPSKRPAKPAARAGRKVVAAQPARRKAVVAAGTTNRKVAVPEIPPPLPAPIASFTF
jgi:hypothetical protein